MTTRRGYVPEGVRRSGRENSRADREVSRLARRDLAKWPPRKEEAPCCQARLDELGRPPLGFCSPECIRRPGNWRLVVAGRPIPRGGVPFREDPERKDQTA